MACYNVMTILVDYRTKEAIEIQKVLTENGCKIKTRLGIHEADDTVCSENGLIILNLVGEDSVISELESKLNAIEGVSAKNVKLCN